jgi:anti-sigma factor RsiW
MKSCTSWKDRLLDYALDALDARQAADVKRHVETCADCARALAGLRSRRQDMDRGLGDLARGAEPSPGFRARVMERIESSATPWPWRLAWAAVPLALILVALASAVFFRQGGGDSLEIRRAEWVAARELVEWRSPTEALLRSPVEELLRSTPQLSAPDISIPNFPGGNQ